MINRNGVRLTKLVSAISLTVLSNTGYTQTQNVSVVSAECAALELESSTTVTSARRLACYNERLSRLSDLLGDLIDERNRLNSTPGIFSESEMPSSEQDNQLVNEQLQTIKQLQLERAELRSQLHQLLTEKETVQLNRDTDQRLFRNYSEAYIALSRENAELKKLLAEHQVSAEDQLLLLDAANKSNQEQSQVIDQLNEEISSLKQTIKDLSTDRSQLDNQFSKAESRIELLQQQLLNNVDLMQGQSSTLSNAQQNNTELTQTLELTNKQLTDTQTQYSQLKALAEQYIDEIDTKNQAIEDLSDQRMALDVEYGKAITEVNELNQQLQGKNDQIQNQLNSITAAQQENKAQSQALESANQQLADSRALASETENSLNSIIDDLNGQIQTLTTQRDDISSDAKRVAQESQQLTAQQASQITDLNNQIVELGNSRDELKTMLSSTEEKLNAANRSFTEEIGLLNEKNSALNADNIDLTAMLAAANSETDQLAMQSTTDMAKLSDLEAQLANVIQSAAATREELSGANESAMQDNRLLEDQVASLTTDLGQLEKQRDRLMKELDNTKTELGSLNDNLDSQTQENQTLRQSIATLQESLQSSKDRASTLEQKLSISDSEQVRSADKVKTLTAAVNSLQGILDETVANNSLIEASLADIKNDLNASQQRLDAKQLELKALMAEKKALIDARNALNNESKQLAESIKQQLKSNDINSVTVNRLADNTLALKLDSSQLFRTGSSRLSDEGQQILAAVGEAIAVTEKRRILIEGHSDNVPLGAKLSAIFKDNLGLSMARALSTAKFFTDTASIPANKMSVSGAGATRPLASNDTAEGRQKNRRVEILLLPVKEP